MTTSHRPTAPSADVVTRRARRGARPRSAIGLDYCCGGRRTLAEACADRRARPDAVLGGARRRSTPGPTPDWALDGARPSWSTTSRPPTTPTSTPSCPACAALADKVVGVHGDRHPELVEIAADLRRAPGRPRAAPGEGGAGPVPDDPRTRREPTAAPTFHCGSLANPISVMLARARPRRRAARRRCATLTDGYQTAGDGCASYQALLRRPRRARGRHPPPRPQGEQPPVPRRGGAGGARRCGRDTPRSDGSPSA